MICVIATIETAAGHRDDLLAVLRKLVPTVRAEKGCIEYTPMIDTPERFGSPGARAAQRGGDGREVGERRRLGSPPEDPAHGRIPPPDRPLPGEHRSANPPAGVGRLRHSGRLLESGSNRRVALGKKGTVPDEALLGARRNGPKGASHKWGLSPFNQTPGQEVCMATATVDLGPVPALWKRRHLLGLEELSAEEITLILDKAEVFKQADGRRAAEDSAADRQDLRQSVLRELHPHAEQLRAGRPAAGGRHARFLRLDQQPVEGRDVHRHGQEHRGDGRRSGGGAASHAGHARICWPKISAAA